MKLLITGLNGTLAPVLARQAKTQGMDVVGWDRAAVSPDDPVACQAWLRAQAPDCIAHLGMGSAEWARGLAAYAARAGVPMVFTSTAMVFHHEPNGPHAVGDQRTAQDDYGQYKRDCEDAILSANPQACVARIGWQIDGTQPGNNMLMALDQWQASEGRVGASRAWRPACSFMEDTANALLGAFSRRMAGVIHIDSNAQGGHNFVQVVQALKAVFHRDAWQIHVHEDYVHDQRLAGGEAWVPPLSARLPTLVSR